MNMNIDKELLCMDYVKPYREIQIGHIASWDHGFIIINYIYGLVNDPINIYYKSLSTFRFSDTHHAVDIVNDELVSRVGRCNWL